MKMEFGTEEEAMGYVKSQLESYLQGMGIDTRKHFRCLNPNHRDENPSMSYDRKRQKAHCFSCGVDYDTIDVIAKNQRNFPYRGTKKRRDVERWKNQG